MPAKINPETRDRAITTFRRAICRKYGITPFWHQAHWFAAADGYILLDHQVSPDTPGAVEVLEPDKSIAHYGTVVRPDGRAKVLADLGSFKIGKSFGSALFYASFAIVPDARVQLVGLEYDICAPEFEYIVDFLLSERGMGIKAESLQNRPRDGRMWLDLPGGGRIEAKSWERKDTLKGKEIDCYGYCEAYMLPGMECYTSFSQNLRARDGYAVFPTTPDRPWLKEFHDRAHSGDPRFRKWHCTCGIAAKANPLTFDQEAMDRDRDLMTREKFSIHYEGQLGDFVGRVYNYKLGDRTFDQTNRPGLFREGHLSLPDGWEIMGAVDTGTFYTGLLVAFDPDGNAYVLDEFPNYRYVAGVPERNESLSIPRWATELSRRTLDLRGHTAYWADANSQFKGELQNYGVTLLPAKIPVETRTEIAREYFEHKRVYLASHLTVLPFELENAAWPEEASATGKFARVKDRDHTLDCLEHILARRPFGRIAPSMISKGSWAAAMGYKKKITSGNIHLGKN